MGLLECDDGNRVSGDGCSKDCKKERFFDCSSSNNSTTGTAICVNNEPPEISSFQLFKNLTAVIAFTKYVHLDEALENILVLELEKAKGNFVTYKVVAFDTEKFKRIQLNLTFNGSLHGTEVTFFMLCLRQIMTKYGDRFLWPDLRLQKLYRMCLTTNSKNL